MDNLTFVVELVKALAWPVGIIAIALILKNPIIELLKQLKSLNVKGVHFDFGKEVSSVAKEASGKLPETIAEPTEKIQKTMELARLSPRGAVLEAWIDVESALKTAARRHALIDDTISPFNDRHVIFQLEMDTRIGKGAVEMFEKLRQLRNDAVHLKENSIDSNSAVEFVNIANRLVRSFEEA